MTSSSAPANIVPPHKLSKVEHFLQQSPHIHKISSIHEGHVFQTIAEKDPEWLVVSPYTALEHLLDLRPLQIHQILLAKALRVLQPTSESYATTPYKNAFNWPLVIDNLRLLARASRAEWVEQSFYIVVFRSQVPPTTDRAHLAELDRISHIEATKSGGLLKYWFGVPDANGRNLATCVWREQKDAKPASSGQGHKAASRATINLYTEWKIERLRLVIYPDEKGGAGDWDIVEWDQ